MKRFVKWMYSQFEILLKTIISVLSVILFSRIKSNNKLNKIKESLIDNEKCYILGNGPSLTSEISGKEEFLKNSNVFAINFFPSTEAFIKIKPKHYCYIDPDLWRENPTIELDQRRDAFILELAEKTKWEMFFYIPWEGYNDKIIQKAFKNHPFIILVPVNITPVNGYEGIVNFLYKHNLGMPRPQNILIATIFFAINLGFKQINVLGCDHSWIENIRINEANQLCIKDVHFYDINEVKLVPWIKDRNNNVFKIHEVLTFFAQAFYSHCLLQKYAEHKKVKVINMTANSYIDAYERAKFY